MNRHVLVPDEPASRRGSVAVVVKNYAIQRSPSILLLLDFLRKQNWHVVLVLENAGALPAGLRADITVVEMPASRFAKALTLLRLRVQCRVDCAIVFDPHAFRLAARFVPFGKILYYSLELYLRGNSFFLSYPVPLADYERRNINKIAGLIIQSDERRRIFRSDYDLSGSIPTFLLPVCASGVGAAASRRSLAARGSRTILHLGGLTPHLGIARFCEAISNIEGWKLLLHGHAFGKQLEELQSRIDDGSYVNVRLDRQYFESPTEAEDLCGQADVGLAWYEPGLSPNFDTAALSSGKIAVYLKHGLPLIVRKHGSFVEILERAGCAAAIDSAEDLPSALAHIERNYERMSERARNQFAECYEFEKYETHLSEFIEATVGL